MVDTDWNVHDYRMWSDSTWRAHRDGPGEVVLLVMVEDVMDTHEFMARVLALLAWLSVEIAIIIILLWRR